MKKEGFGSLFLCSFTQQITHISRYYNSGHRERHIKY